MFGIDTSDCECEVLQTRNHAHVYRNTWRRSRRFTFVKLACPLATRIRLRTFSKSPLPFRQIAKNVSSFPSFNRLELLCLSFRENTAEEQTAVQLKKKSVNSEQCASQSQFTRVPLTKCVLEEFSICHPEMCAINPKVLILLSCLFVSKVPLRVSAGSGEMSAGLFRVLCDERLWNSCSRLLSSRPSARPSVRTKHTRALKPGGSSLKRLSYNRAP